MIVTFTANPSLDRTGGLSVPLRRGSLHRLSSATVEPGGKGVNVARALKLAGVDVVAVLPARSRDPILSLLEERGVPVSAVEVTHPVRTNLTLTEPDGTTTKLNESGAQLGADDLTVLQAALVIAARRASWVALSGSLPPGAPSDWYATLVRTLRPFGCKIAVDTSDDPLRELAKALPDAAPDLLKPNSEELAQLSGADGEEMEERAALGDLVPVVKAARTLVDSGVRTVLATLGAAGAVLVDGDGAWHATPPPITPRSTVGAGDSSVAGYLIADVAGEDALGRLRRAVAYGSAAASLEGSALPSPSQIDLDGVTVSPVDV